MRVAADANVLFSALIGGKAGWLRRHPAIEEALTTEFTLTEVHEYAAHLARKRGLAVDLVMLAAALPVTTIPQSEYRRALPEARRRIGKRDPDDVELLALAIQFGIAVWSNDHDFEDAGVTWHTTASLPAVLEG